MVTYMAKGNQSCTQIKDANQLTLKREVEPGLSRWVPSSITRVLESRRHRQKRVREVITESEVRDTQCEREPALCCWP